MAATFAVGSDSIVLDGEVRLSEGDFRLAPTPDGGKMVALRAGGGTDGSPGVVAPHAESHYTTDALDLDSIPGDLDASKLYGGATLATLSIGTTDPAGGASAPFYVFNPTAGEHYVVSRLGWKKAPADTEAYAEQVFFCERAAPSTEQDWVFSNGIALADGQSMASRRWWVFDWVGVSYSASVDAQGRWFFGSHADLTTAIPAQISLPAATTDTGGIAFGETKLYREAASRLRTGGAFAAASFRLASTEIISAAGVVGGVSVPFALLTSLPSTLAGYGITDAQPLDADLTLLAGLTLGANQFPARSSAGALAAKTITDFGLTLVDDADAAAARTTLGLVIGTHVQAFDAELAALAGVASAADKGLYFTGPGTAGTFDLTSFARTVLDDADAATALNTLGAQPLDATLTALAGVTLTAGGMLYSTGADALSNLVNPGTASVLTHNAAVPVWVTTLAKAQQHAQTAYLDAPNVWSSTNQYNGVLGVGVAPSTTTGILVGFDSGLTGTNQVGINVDCRFGSAATSQIRGIGARVRTAAAAFAVTTGAAIQVSDAVLGSGSAITTLVGVDVGVLAAGGTNIAIRTGDNQSRFGGQVIVGSSATAPNAAASLQLEGTTRGVLLPRLTTTQRDAISAPPAGLLIYNTTTNKLNIRAASAWEAVTSA